MEYPLNMTVKEQIWHEYREWRGYGYNTVTGELRIDSGTFNYGSGNNTMTVSLTTGILTMNGGTLNMLGAVAISSSAGTQFIMSGGNINVDPNATNALSTFTTVFSIGSSTTVNWCAEATRMIDQRPLPHCGQNAQRQRNGYRQNKAEQRQLS